MARGTPAAASSSSSPCPGCASSPAGPRSAENWALPRKEHRPETLIPKAHKSPGEREESTARRKGTAEGPSSNTPPTADRPEVGRKEGTARFEHPLPPLNFMLTQSLRCSGGSCGTTCLPPLTSTIAACPGTQTPALKPSRDPRPHALAPSTAPLLQDNGDGVEGQADDIVLHRRRQWDLPSRANETRARAHVPIEATVTRNVKRTFHSLWHLDTILVELRDYPVG